MLQELVKGGRISSAEVGRCLQICQLERQLASLRGGGGRRVSARPARQRAARRRGRRITAEQLASRQLQGRYLGLIRQISASQRSRYAKIAKDRGREAAIKEMQGALNK